MGENLAPRRSGELDRASGRPRGRPRGASRKVPRGKKWIWPEREHMFGRPVRQERSKRAGAGGGLPGPSKRTPDRFSDTFSRPLNLSTPHDTPLTPRTSGSANFGIPFRSFRRCDFKVSGYHFEALGYLPGGNLGSRRSGGGKSDPPEVW